MTVMEDQGFLYTECLLKSLNCRRMNPLSSDFCAMHGQLCYDAVCLGYPNQVAGVCTWSERRYIRLLLAFS